jgi:hypothetical protein
MFRKHPTANDRGRIRREGKRDSRSAAHGLNQKAKRPSVEVQAIQWHIPVVTDNMGGHTCLYPNARYAVSRCRQDGTLQGLHAG